DQAGIGPRLPNAPHALRVPVAPELQLEQRQIRDSTRRRGHDFGCAEAHGVAGEDGSVLADAGKVGRGSAGPLRLEVPEGAIECIACGIRRPVSVEAVAVEIARRGLDCVERPLRCLAVARIRHALAATRGRAVGDARYDDPRLPLGTTRYDECTGQRPAFDGGVDDEVCHATHLRAGRPAVKRDGRWREPGTDKPVPYLKRAGWRAVEHYRSAAPYRGATARTRRGSGPPYPGRPGRSGNGGSLRRMPL